MLMNFLVIALAGALGASLRYGLNLLMASFFASSFPLATLLVNVLGSFLIGLLAASQDSLLKLGLMVGFLGALTTYSSFSLETLRLLEAGAYGQFFANAILTPVLAFSACAFGLYFARSF